MRRSPLPALLRLLIIAGGATYANPYQSESGRSWLELPLSHTALEGDLHGSVGGVLPSPRASVRVKRAEDEAVTLVATVAVEVSAERRFSIPCGYFSRGGVYYLEIADSENGTEAGEEWRLDVRWPAARLSVTPERVETYPERPVTAIVEFPNVVCEPLPPAAADFWLELLYCGHASGGAVLCDGKNASSHAHVLSSEQVRGAPGRRTMALRCELFGQAGDYALTLRPATAAPAQDYAAVFIKADWSEQFVLNVHGGSVFPCGGGGVRALFQYPACVLERADRVRLFGKSGDRMRYVAERRVRRGQHTATFDCRLFSERYPEYCFVYVSQAVTGAVANVREDCLPTLPLSEGAAGGWGEWSAWSQCPPAERCSTATRSRHRFCDSPPPAYGAKYCEGRAVEISMCACASATAAWEAADAPAVVAEVGVGCRCGCVLHLAQHPRLLAGSTRACPGHSFWLLKAEVGMAVRLRVEAARLPCGGQSLRARAGDSLAAPLLASWDGGTPTARSVAASATVVPQSEEEGTNSQAVEVVGGRHILIDLRTDDGGGEMCAGGFIAHAMQIDRIRNVSAAWFTGSSARGWWWEAGAARAVALALAGTAVAAALLLAAHSAHRTRAYQRAADKDTLADSDACSASLELVNGNGDSRSTLLSELPAATPVRAGGVSLRKLLSLRARHQRLRESYLADETQELRDCENDGDAASVGSTITITPEGACQSSRSAPVEHQPPEPSPLRRSHTVGTEETAGTTTVEIVSPPPPSIASERSEAVDLSAMSVSSTSREGDSCSEKDRDSMAEKESSSRASSVATLTNGWYSPALSGVCAARVRGNTKRGKETCNRRRLLRSSDLSLGSSTQEMEIDYYDYEVNNAGAAPGSYLGMDPAFLVWIPPLEEGEIADEKLVPDYEEIIPQALFPDPGSNTETPDTDSKPIYPDNRILSSPVPNSVHKLNRVHPLNFSITDLQNSPKLRKRSQKAVSIPMRELPKNATSKKSADKRENEEANRRKKLSDLSDIRYADDNSDSSNEIKFMDDYTPDSNKMCDDVSV